ncbi:DNA cytosine methyltransferase [Telluribacter humicola]|uniref:DNA cytosine methyltransferase n=1 Tax=Telluribacter humicola TaxID=1720261 RepID=UPI001A978867|nr:DNA (cytosine-5-)-methyltransferase [Telluribacter humicola]
MNDLSQQKTVAEYFAGIGLMRAGLEQAGWTVALANDIDPVKQKLYQNHFQDPENHFILEDIHKVSPAIIPQTDLATASFPCTDLSLAGRRAGLKGEHSSAFWGFIEILQGMGSKKPPLVLLENVTGFLTSHDGRDFRDALLALNDLGYAVDTFIIDAVHFVPQSRIRLFIIGKLLSSPPVPVKLFFPETELRPVKLRNFIFNHPEINWDINFDLPKLPVLRLSIADIVEDIPKSSSLWFNTERVEYLLNQTFERHLSKILEQKEKCYYEYYTAFRRVRDGKSMAEIRFDGIAGCLRTPKGGSARQILLQVGKGDVNVRLLTPKECARLMGVDNFNISGTVTEALFGFGDAVCVPVISWIAENYLNVELSKILNKKASRLDQYAAAS